MASSTNRALLWWTLGIVGVIAVIFGLSQLSGGPSTATIASILQVNDADHVQGPATGVTVVEYSDFQCPACSYYFPIVQAAQKKLGDKMRLVYREFPLRSSHQNAQIAAQAAEAASLQGKFWEMHDLLFGRQSSWSSSSDAKAVFIGYAGELKLDVKKFTTDIDSQAVIDRVQRDVDSGTRINLQGTPTFYINGKQLNTPFTEADLETAITANSNT